MRKTPDALSESTAGVGTERWSLRPAIIAWLFLAILTSTPYLRARLDPPRGMTFLGFFYFIDDMYNYLSYVQQAEDGAFGFVNKLTTAPHPPALVNLEWWSVGRLSALLGRRPILAYRIFGILAALAFVLGADRWLRRAGLPATHTLPALLLVFTGAGLGGIRYELMGPPAWRSLDLVTGLFPFIELLVNPHFVAGTALLLWALLGFSVGGVRGNLQGLVLGTILGLVRPYDLVLLGGIRALALLWTEPPRAWPRGLAVLAGLLPVSAYNYWLFYRNPAFASLSQYAYVFPPLRDFALALGPALALALLAWTNRARGGGAFRAQAHLLAWTLLGLLVLAFRPVSFSLQFLAGFGVPLLALGALGLSRWKPAVTLAVAFAFATTAFFAVRIVLSEQPRWFVAGERWRAALALRSSCRPGDLVLAPPDIGLYAMGLSACKAYLSHGIVTEFESRDEEAQQFFEGTDVARRADLLDRRCITHLVLPGDPGETPREWLGDATPFRRVAIVRGLFFTISIFARPGPVCPPSP